MIKIARFVDTIQHINTSQFEIDKNVTKVIWKTFKQHFKYLKDKDKNAYNMNKNMVNVFIKLQLCNMWCLHKRSNTNAFANQYFKSSFDEQPMLNNQDINEK